MNDRSLQQLSQELSAWLCGKYGYIEVDDFNWETGLAKACKEKNGTVFQIHVTQELSRILCEKYGYHRIGGFDLETGLAWACRKKGGRMFHIHFCNGQPAYEHTYRQVQGFRAGRACAKDDSGLWQFHIAPNGLPAYPARFEYVGLFFKGLADAEDETGRFHIRPNGRSAYKARFKKVGHFCYGLAQARDKSGHFHIRPDGKPNYPARFLMNGPFNEQGIAIAEVFAVNSDNKKIKVRIHINRDGSLTDSSLEKLKVRHLTLLTS